MKKILIILSVIISLLCYPISTVQAANTHSIDIEVSSQQRAYAADSADLSITGDISIELWINLEQLPSTYGSIMYLISKAGSWKGFNVYIHSADDTLWFQYVEGTNDYAIEDSDAAIVTAGDVGNWVHLAVTADVSAQDIILYKNGSPVASTVNDQGATAIVDSADTFDIGRNTEAANGSYDGKMDDIRVWNDIRSGAEISDNYQTQLNGNETGLVAYWMLNNTVTDEGEGTDPAGSDSDDLTLVNTPVYDTSTPFNGAVEEEFPVMIIQ